MSLLGPQGPESKPTADVCGLKFERMASNGRYPRCNRVVGHEGPHRLYDRLSFAVKAEWTDAEVKVDRKRHSPA